MKAIKKVLVANEGLHEGESAKKRRAAASASRVRSDDVSSVNAKGGHRLISQESHAILLRCAQDQWTWGMSARVCRCWRRVVTQMRVEVSHVLVSGSGLGFTKEDVERYSEDKVRNMHSYHNDRAARILTNRSRLLLALRVFSVSAARACIYVRAARAELEACACFELGILL